jgi:CBS domain-containing protein
MKVKNAMHKGVTCLESNAPISEIAKCMRDADIGAIPIKERGQVVGMVTDRDITCRAFVNGGDVSKMTARDIMTKNVVCCSPDDDLQAAIKLMESTKIRRLPVMDDQKTMIGMLSLGDISHKVNRDLSGEVLRAVSGHHS